MFVTGRVPEELIDLYHFIQDISEHKVLFDAKELNKRYHSFRAYIDDIRKNWFPKSEILTGKDEYYAGQLFQKEIDTKDIRHHIKIHLIAIILSADRFISRINHNLNNQTKPVRFYDELFLFNELVFEAIQFLSWNQYHIKGYPAGYKLGKRMILHSAEIFSASRMLLRNRIIEKTMGDFVVRPTSVFLLRQSIELRLKNAFGIFQVTDLSGKILKNFPLSVLFSLIKSSSSSVTLPMKVSLVQNIYKWSNYYIHLGVVPQIWEIEWAHHVLRPLFASGKYKNTKSIFGSIKIKRTFYDEVEKNIREIYRNDKILIERLPSPESIIID